MVEPVPARVAAAVRAAAGPVCAYVYDLAAVRGAAARVRAALPAGSVLLYAVKANGHPAVVAALAEVCDGLEVASGGELALAGGARFVAFGGPAKTDAELAAAVAGGALVHVESAHELRRLAALADRPVDVAVRVNRAGGGPAGSHRMTGVATPFGVDEAQLGDVLAVDRGRLRVVGFHLHAVSNNLDAAAHVAFVADALDWSVATAARYGVELSYVNVGGGFGVDMAGTATIDLGVLRAGLAGVRVPPGVRLVFEPGRLLVADAGWYAAEVLDLKTTHGRTFAVLRGGTHHFRLPAAWGYDHPFAVLGVDRWAYPWPRPVVSGPVDAVGELCTPRDVLCRGQHVAGLRVGDVLVFARTGAYGWDISHHDFLHHPHPEVVVLPARADDDAQARAGR